MRRQGEYDIDPLAVQQLAAWERIAKDWPLRAQLKDTQLQLVCLDDGITVFVLVDRFGHGYTMTNTIVLAATVAHLRNIHRELDPDG